MQRWIHVYNKVIYSYLTYNTNYTVRRMITYAICENIVRGAQPLTSDKDFQTFKNDMLSKLFYKPGETVRIMRNTAGYFTTGGRDLIFHITVGKSLLNVNSAIMTSARLIVRQSGKYAFGNGDFETVNLNTDKPGVNFATTDGELDLGFTFSVSRAITNNDACGVAYDVYVRFS